MFKVYLGVTQLGQSPRLGTLMHKPTCKICGIRYEEYGQKARHCKECRRAYDRERYAKRSKISKAKLLKQRKARRARLKQKFLALKQGKSCADCGETDSVVLEYDHLPQFEKLFNLADYEKRPWKAVLDEIQKCEIVCANCHRRRTHKRQSEYSST